ncbi:hypothetical protein [Pedobacter glucosidilyticus]|uniref:hypothetical protein n=1 Tax=Pedobacter glucosidilyticus TaxID=1122941 RepID=UPI0026EAA87F|nr:hypothetical protein [Pedobacter glucosidilyticus]
MMNKQEILKKIGNIILELNEQHQYLSQVQKINILELELFTANADFLIDHIEILKKLNDTKNWQEDVNSIHTAKPVLEEPAAPPLIEHHQVIEVVSEPQAHQEEIADDEHTLNEPALPEFKFSFDEPEPTEMIFDFEKKLSVEEVFDRVLTAEEQRVLAEKQQALAPMAETEIQEMDQQDENILLEQEAEPFIITQDKPAQLLEEEPVQTPPQSIAITQTIPTEKQAEAEKPKSLNEVLSANRELPGAKSYSRPIADLKASISLNDKMMFIKELFNGYNLAYSEAIEILNRFDNFEASDNFLMKNYADKNNWAAKQEVVDRLYEILNRKFKN